VLARVGTQVKLFRLNTNSRSAIAISNGATTSSWHAQKADERMFRRCPSR
jgi:hypothetical protein